MMKRERDPTPEEFDKFLAWLNPDRDEAGRRFESITARLIKVFSGRGCIDAASLADEVINRVAVRIETVIQKYTDPIRCCVGFVDNVHKEYLREQRQITNAVKPPEPRPSEELEKEDRCLTGCLRSFSKPDGDFVTRYFYGQKRIRILARQKLALELKLTANALRIRAHHLRKKLRQCIVECLSQT